MTSKSILQKLDPLLINNPQDLLVELHEQGLSDMDTMHFMGIISILFKEYKKRQRRDLRSCLEFLKLALEGF